MGSGSFNSTPFSHTLKQSSIFHMSFREIDNIFWQKWREARVRIQLLSQLLPFYCPALFLAILVRSEQLSIIQASLMFPVYII